MRCCFHPLFAACSLLILFFNGLGARAAQPGTPPKVPTAAEVVPQSIFVIDYTGGRDPFFPKSTRFQPKTNAAVAVVQPAGPDLALKGVSGTPGRRLAIIQNRTFETGEEGEVKVNGQTVRVKCVEIKDKSVVIKQNGFERELFLQNR